MDEDEPPERIVRSHEIGYLIRNARKRRRWSQSYLAEQIKVSRKTISELENGRCAKIAFESVLKAAHQVNLSVLVAPRRLPTADEVIRDRAIYLNRIERMLHEKQLATEKAAQPRRPRPVAQKKDDSV